MKECIGRQAVIKRLLKYGTADIVIIRPSRSIIIVVSSNQINSPSPLDEFLATPSIEAIDIVKNLSVTLRNSAVEQCKIITDDFNKLVGDIYGSNLLSIVSVLNGTSEFILNYAKNERIDELMKDHSIILKEWLNVFPLLDQYFENEIKENNVTLNNLISLFVDTQTPMYCWSISNELLKSISIHSLFPNLELRSQKEILRKLCKD